MRLVLSVLAVCFSLAPPTNASESVTIVRDRFGVPHVYAESDTGAFYGAGYACAEDRWLQLCVTRLEYQGRYAEFFGPGPGNKFLKRDRFVRTIGLERLAQREYDEMVASSSEALEMFQAYADGVNRWVADHPNEINPEFDTVFGAEASNVQSDWTVQDCLGVWLRTSTTFQGFGGREQDHLIAFEEYLDSLGSSGFFNWDDARVATFGLNKFDDTAATILPADVAPAQMQAMQTFADTYQVPPHPGATLGSYTPPGFSEGAAISADRMEGDYAVLIGAPRVPAQWPNLFYEWQMQGETFDVRGWGQPGCPNLYAGSSATNAWTPESMTLDMSDVFSVRVDATEDNYFYDGSWVPFDVDFVETIEIDGQPDETLHYRETVWGPEVTNLSSVIADPTYPDPDEIYCLKTVLHDDPPPPPTGEGFLAMYRASSLEDFYAATEGWIWPSVHLVFANADGRVGYTVVGRMPVRTASHPFAGHMVMDGSISTNDWQTFVPHDLRPHVLDPVAGWVSNGNNLSIGSWYPMSTLLPDYGDNSRARITRELTGVDPGANGISYAYAENILRNKVNTNVRDIVRIGIFLEGQGFISASSTSDAYSALELLQPWYANGGARHEHSTYPGVLLAWLMKVKAFTAQTPDSLVLEYGDSTSGLCNFLKQMVENLDSPSPKTPTADEAAEIIRILEDSYLAARALLDSNGNPLPESEYLDYYQENILSGEIERWGALAVPPLDTTTPLPYGPVRCNHNGTLLAVRNTSYNQFVKVGEVDGARSLLALGISERLGDPHELDQMPKWTIGQLKPSPTTFAGIQAMDNGGPPTWERETIDIP